MKQSGVGLVNRRNMLQHEREQIGNDERCREAIKSLLVVAGAIGVKQCGVNLRPNPERFR